MSKKPKTACTCPPQDPCGQRWLDTGNAWGTTAANDNPTRYADHQSDDFCEAFCLQCRFAEDCENQLAAEAGEEIEEWQTDPKGQTICIEFEPFNSDDLHNEETLAAAAEKRAQALLHDKCDLEARAAMQADRCPLTAVLVDPEEVERTRHEHANDNPDLEAKPAPQKAGKPKTKSRPASLSTRPSKGRPWVQLPLPLRRNGKPLPPNLAHEPLNAVDREEAERTRRENAGEPCPKTQPQPKTAKEA